jgi:mRNA interferase MazF
MPEHQKDFDGWNERKKEIHQNTQEIYFSEQEVWWCALGINVGHEQDGVVNASQRPVLVLKKWSKDT